VLIILDGYDEISEQKARVQFISNLRAITNSLTNSKFILTSRSADYDVHIDNTSEYEICPLNESQIELFIKKWIANEAHSTLLNTQLKTTPYWDTTMRPLTLAHLCALYERNNSIPDKPKSVYKKIIQLLLEDWTNQGSVKRKSRYGKFEVDRKMDFLSRFAFELSVDYRRSSFDQVILEQIYNTICNDFSLPVGESSLVVKEIESHNGLILQTGANIFEFAHKSLLEYLVADYLVKLPVLFNKAKLLLAIPNELAILISISSSPSLMFYELILKVLKHECLDSAFLKPFLSRLFLEKPDFDSSPLYALTVIFLLEAIAIRLYNEQNNLPLRNGTKIEFTEEINKHENQLEDDFRDDFEDDFEDEAIFDEEDIYDLYSNKSVERKVENDTTDYDDEGEDNEDDEFEVEEYNRTGYLNECASIILSLKNDESFRGSMLEIRKVFMVSEIEDIKNNNPKSELKKWGKIFLLQPIKDYYNYQTIRIPLPKNLLLTGDFKTIKYRVKSKPISE
jgi:hypothetical protein